MRFRKREKGFTLIELLVVVAIIAILAAILFPVFAQAKRKAVMNSCINNLKQISAAVNMYQNDYDERFPLVTGFGRELDRVSTYFQLGTTNLRGGNERVWFQYLLLPYVKNDKIFVCPAVGKNGTWQIGNQVLSFAENWASEIGTTEPTTTYIFNARCLDTVTNQWYVISGQSEGICDRPGDAPLIWDAPDGYAAQGSNEATLAHGDAINIAYVDGHVKTLSVPNISHPDWTGSHFWSKHGSDGWVPPP